MSTYRLTSSFLLVITLLFVLTACEDDDPVKPAVEEKFEGITLTDEANNLLGGDSTDWRPRPLYEYRLDSLGHQALVCTQSGVYPAFPNPVKYDATLTVVLSQQDSVWILVYATPGGLPVDTVYNGVLDSGRRYLYWHPDLPTGIYRVYMKSTHGLDAYGDVQVEE